MIDPPAPVRWRRSLHKPLLWALAAIIVVVAGFAFFHRDDYEKAELPFVARQIQEHKVQSATIEDNEQRIEITTTDGQRFHARWKNPGQAQELADALQEAQPAGGYTIRVSTTLFLWDPFLMIFLGAVVVAVLVAVSRRTRRFQKDR
jgi:cell division protease FtsH